jgi:hypothetical protein
MKKILYTFLTLILFNGLVQAQFKTDFVFGFNRTAIVNATYEDRIDMAEPPAPKRSNKATFGLQFEYEMKSKKNESKSISIVSGLLYLKNGYQYSESFSGISYKQSDLTATWLQIPFTFRYNVYPKVLLEDWRVYGGIGVYNNLLMKAQLYELSLFNINGELEEKSADEDIKKYGQSMYQFANFEVGSQYKKFSITIRYKFALQDMHFEKLEANWPLSTSESVYLSDHESFGRTRERHIEFVIGYRIF